MRRAKIAKSFAVVMVSLSLVGCTQPGSEAIAQGTTPETAMRAYANSLASGNLAAFWAHDFNYNLIDVETETKNLPKAMWDQRIEGIKRKWLRKIEEDRISKVLGPRPWQVIRPGSSIEVLEIRAEREEPVPPGYESERRSRWQAFVKVKYPSENQSPIGGGGQVRRPVQEVTVIFRIVQNHTRSKQLLISGCEFVPRGISFRSIPALEQNAVLEMAKAKIPTGPSWIEFSADGNAWRAPIMEGQIYRQVSPSLVKQVEQIQSLLQRHGVQVKNPRIQGDSHVIDRLEVPEIWKPHYLGRTHNSPYERYALSESVELKLVPYTFHQETAGTAQVKIQVNYLGCSPVCALYLDLQKLNNPYGNLVFPGYPRAGFPTSLKKEVFYTWNVTTGWEVTHVADVWGQ